MTCREKYLFPPSWGYSIKIFFKKSKIFKLLLFSGHLVNNILSQIRGAKDIVASLVSHFGSVVTTCSGDQSGPIRAMFFASKMAASAFSRYCKAQWAAHYSWQRLQTGLPPARRMYLRESRSLSFGRSVGRSVRMSLFRGGSCWQNMGDQRKIDWHDMRTHLPSISMWSNFGQVHIRKLSDIYR